MKNCFNICATKKPMIKYAICFLFLLTLPAYAANDSCSNPGEYTIDRRCYVTDAKKQKFPYNSVVKLIDDDGGYCSGTIVNFGSEQYIVTAHHCATKSDSDIIQQEIHATMPNGGQITAHYHSDGSGGNTITNKNYENKDWAFYRIDNVSTPFVKGPGTKWLDVKDIDNMPVWIIAYGSLKIMSDAEIQDFKSRYIKYLRSRKKAETKENGVSYGGIHMNDTLGIEFLMAMGKNYYKNLLEDMDNMKISFCVMPQYYCQGWYGASGGGFFDENGNIVGIVSQGVSYIGGKWHGFVDIPAVPTQMPDDRILKQPSNQSFPFKFPWPEIL